MLALPGFIEANTLNVTKHGDTHIHCVQYVLRDQPALDAYVADHAPHMRKRGVAKFGGDLEASRSVRKVIERNREDTAECLNCQATLTGQYCWNCGQRGNTRLISLWELVRDAVGDLFELDSRLWRTVIPLLTKPGFLTADYLQGRRARYMPPFRMYLVMSFVFFLIAQIDADFDDGDVSIGIGPEQVEAAIDDIDIEGQIAAAGENLSPEDAAMVRKTLERFNLDRESRQAADEPEPVATDAERERPQNQTIDATPQELDLEAAEAARLSETVDRLRQANEKCSDMQLNLSIPGYSEQELQKRAMDTCVSIYSDRGRRLSERGLQALPIAMMALLPLMAMFLKMMYPLSRRYYVEHLLLLVHYHAFVFLAITLLAGVMATASWLSVPDWLLQMLVVAVILYIAIYLYKTMRRVYRQGRFITIIKYLVIATAYVLAMALVIAIGAIILLLTY